jgi:hypothetical protein
MVENFSEKSAQKYVQRVTTQKMITWAMAAFKTELLYVQIGNEFA